MNGATPSPAVTKFGSVLVIFAIALLAVWAANNFAMLGQWTRRRNNAAA